MAQVAVYTFGILRGPRGEAQVQGFFDRITDTFGTAEGTPGYVTRRGNRPAALGPRFFSPGADPHAPQTLSVWRDLESIYAFAYRSGAHGEALRLRSEWFVKPAWPTYVAWWVDDGALPEWEEGIARLEHLHDHGPTPYAFTFTRAHDPAGNPVALDRRRIAGEAATVS